jgi:hypothetical protein
MNKAHLNYIIDIIMLIVGSIVAITGILKLPVLQSVYRTLPTKMLTQLHDISGVVIVILVIIHLILHWKWIVFMTKSVFKKKEICAKK